MLELDLEAWLVLLRVESSSGALLAYTPAAWFVFVGLPPGAMTLVAARVHNFVRHGTGYTTWRVGSWDAPANLDVN